ncbi:MAG: atpH [Rickettsiaceae bacterium]|jgi:F-type H+-transporting ATPase subunit delta|nr:atpH [Rickettsiaceae bacterium]
MAYNQVIMSYARAIFEVAKNTDSLSETREKLDSILHLINNNPDLGKSLSAPVVDFDQKTMVVREISTKMHLSLTIQNLLLLLAKNKRFKHIFQVVEAFDDLMKEEQGILEARITTAKDISDTEFQELQKLITEKYNESFTFTKSVDSSLVGGLIVEFDNKILDASVRGALKKFKNKSKEIISVL